MELDSEETNDRVVFVCCSFRGFSWKDGKAESDRNNLSVYDSKAETQIRRLWAGSPRDNMSMWLRLAPRIAV